MSDTAGHYQAITDQVNIAPKLEVPLKRRHVWPQTAEVSGRFVNKKTIWSAFIVIY